MVQEFIADKCETRLSVRRVRWYLRLWGCVWGRVYEMPPVDPIMHKKRVAQCIMQLEQARADERNGTHVIVYTDESYIHDNHAIQFSWFPANSTHRVARAKRRGRLIIFHAITKDGLLYRTRSDSDGDLNVPTLNAEYIYHIDPQKASASEEKKSTATRGIVKSSAETVATLTDKKDDKEDYHGNIGTDMWMKWLENRLIPAFKAAFPQQKMLLVMDNASYHNAHEDGWVSASAMTKDQLAKAFDKYGIDAITVDREESDGGQRVIRQHRFTKETFSRKVGGGSAPTVQEMKKVLSDYYREHKDLIMTRTKRRFSEESGWRIVWTPPLEPQCQPIERLWGMVKNNVAWQYKVGRTVEETRQQLLRAFYEFEYPEREDEKKRREASGEEEKRPLKGVTASHCQGMIRRSREWMEKWISTEGVLMRDGNSRLHYREPTADSDTNISDDPLDQLARAADVDDEWNLHMEDSDCDEEDVDDEPAGLDALVAATADANRANVEPELLIPYQLRIHPLFTQITEHTHTNNP